MQTLWKHSLGGLGTKWFAEKTGYKELAQRTFSWAPA